MERQNDTWAMAILLYNLFIEIDNYFLVGLARGMPLLTL
jgi:hypothetical protein